MQIGETRLDITKSGPKVWYLEWVRTRKKQFSREDGWSREMQDPEHLGEATWSDIFSLSFKTSRETKLQSFAFKLIYRLTPCNRYLERIRIKQTDICSFCPQVDSITHFFLQCDRVAAFWNNLDSWCLKFMKVRLQNISSTERLLGVTRKLPDARLINWITLKAKFFIQKKKLFHNGEISLIAFLAEVKDSLRTERNACLQEGRLWKFDRWKKLYAAVGGTDRP